MRIRRIRLSVKQIIGLSAAIVLILASVISPYFIYQALQVTDYEEVLGAFEERNRNDSIINTLNIKSNLEDSSFNGDSRKNPVDRNINVNCIWTDDKNNRNVTFYVPNSDRNVYEYALTKDLECDVRYGSNDDGTKKVPFLQDQFPLLIFDDFVQNFFSDKKFADAGISVTKQDCSQKLSGLVERCFPVDNLEAMRKHIENQKDYIENSATELVGQILDKIPFGPELTLLDSITFQNRVTSPKTEQGSNGIYRHVGNQNDETNIRNIKIIVDTYTEQTKPLESDIDNEEDFRFDVENAIHTLVHEYGHHLTLYSEQLTKDTFLSTMKRLFTGAKLHDNSISCLSSAEKLNKATVACGNWDDYEALFRYSNGYSSVISDKEAIQLFRRLYGMVKTKNESESSGNFVFYPKDFSHELKWRITDEDKPEFIEEWEKFEPRNPLYEVKTRYVESLNSSKIHGAQKLSTLIPNAQTEYIVYDEEVLFSVVDSDETEKRPTDLKLNCQNEYFYFYGQSFDYEAILTKYNPKAVPEQIDASVLGAIKYYFSMEEQLARMYSIITFQYEKGPNGSQVRPLSGCGFTYSTGNWLNFSEEVRLENKHIVDHLSLKRFGIDAYTKSSELMDFFIPTKATKENQMKFARYNQNYNGTQTSFYSFPKSVFANPKIVYRIDGNLEVYRYTKYPSRYKLLSLVNLEPEDRYLAPLITIDVPGISTNFRAVPYNYNNYFYYQYKEGMSGVINPSSFDKSVTLSDNFGVVFDVGGEGLSVLEIFELFSREKIESSVVFIDKNNDGKFGSGDKRLSLSFN